MGLCSSIATTFNTPLLLGGPASVTWCWILGACMCFTLGAQLPVPHHPTSADPLARRREHCRNRERVPDVRRPVSPSATAHTYDADPVLARYTASAQLCPPRHRAIVGWVVGWLNILGESLLMTFSG